MCGNDRGMGDVSVVEFIAELVDDPDPIHQFKIDEVSLKNQWAA